MKKRFTSTGLVLLAFVCVFAVFVLSSCEMSSPSYCWDCGKPLEVKEEADINTGKTLLYYQCTSVPSHRFGISETKPKEHPWGGE